MASVRESVQAELETHKLIYDSELKNHFEIRYKVRWRNTYEFTEFDIVLYTKDIIYAIFEIKTNLEIEGVCDNAKRQINSALKLTNCRFGVITDNTTFFLKDAEHLDKGFVKMDFEQIVHNLITPDKIVQTRDGIENIKIILETFFANTDIATSICNDIKYDDTQGFFNFTSIDEERSFFLHVIGKLNDNQLLYRYTTLDTLFAMLNKKTYRMNGIVGMNDKSEIDYFDKKCKKIKSGSTVQELNDTYISSCSTLKDDLTMWRLYGDDGKGVCLEFEMLPAEKRLNNFILAPVNYAEEREKHRALDMLDKLSSVKVRLTELYKWKHFFKPFDYNVEKEIRLMFFDNGRYNNGVVNRDWIKTITHSIINPIVDFNFNSSGFPLQLKRIILGPKMQELSINENQIGYLISQKGYNIEVCQSEIKNYR